MLYGKTTNQLKYEIERLDAFREVVVKYADEVERVFGLHRTMAQKMVIAELKHIIYQYDMRVAHSLGKPMHVESRDYGLYCPECHTKIREPAFCLECDSCGLAICASELVINEEF